ncbi:MAG: GNAT family N-acetyltransferase [Candidatus Heimdallarchaeaceae archaeon]|jgi:GNAT superfamily N-acetyltransferase
MEFEIREFKPKEVSDEFWEVYFEFVEANTLYHNPNDPLPNREGVIQRQKTDIPNFLIKRWLVFTPENKIVGWAGFGASLEGASDYEENKHICQINIAVLHTHERKGIGTALLKVLVQEALSLNRTVIEVGANNEAGKAFLKKHGAEFTIEGAENRLELEDLDWDLMQSWIEEGPKRAEGVTIETFFECPDEIIDEYTELYTEALNMQPLGEIEYRPFVDARSFREREERQKELEQINYTMISREKDGRISGMTEVFYDPKDSYRMFQGLTGVRPKFRGRGIGKWLKGKMILHVKDNYPEVTRIITGNAEANAPMLSINNRMGFKKYKGEEGFKFKVEELVKKLGI